MKLLDGVKKKNLFKMNKFCYLESDDKTYQYINVYYTVIKDNNYNTIFNLDNEIQKIEIENHCKRCNISEENKNVEILNWIDNNGKNFRIYLNTIKIAAFLFYFENSKKNITDINSEDLKTFIKRFNEIKEKLIDTLF
jgi:hypothetical protein